MKLRTRTAPKATLALPAWFWFVFFFALPVMWIAYYSFGNKPDLYHAISTNILNTHQYALAASSTFLRTFIGTLRISITGTAICLLIALPFAYWLAVITPPRRRGLFLALVLVPFWTNFLVRTIGWRILLSPHGPVGFLLNLLGWHSGSLQILDTRAAVQLGVVYNYLPLMILPIYVALERMDKALREASKDLGANRIRTFNQVTLPLAMPGVVAGCLLVFIPLTGDFITATVLGGAKGNMAGQMVYDQFMIAQNWALGSAMAVELLVIILLTTAIFGILGLGIRTFLRSRRRVNLAMST